MRDANIGEQSNTSNAPIFSFMDDDSDGEDWSHFLGGEGNDDDSRALYEDHEPGEGANETPLHAMVLLGTRIVDGSRYWLLQRTLEKAPSESSKSLLVFH